MIDWMLSSLDGRDVVYLVAGLAFMGLTALPLLDRRMLSVPTLYVAIGALLAFTPFALPVIDPFLGSDPGAGFGSGSGADGVGDWARRLVEHATELIVIISLAGAGLAIDRPGGRSSWQHTWRLLLIAMPLTLAAVTWLGAGFAALPLASAVLLAACLAPTDPVLARVVQVEAPLEGEEDDVRVSLTTEAGLNDGLAFPFVYLAILLAGGAGAAAASDVGLGGAVAALRDGGWLGEWLGFHLLYRVAAGLGMGWLCGQMLARFVLGRFGDAESEDENSGLVLMGTTFLSYGLTEAIAGYGFLAVFVAARAGRAVSRGDEDEEEYSKKPHRFSDQVEKILLALLLLWFGSLIAAGTLAGTTWREVAVALAILFFVRPLAGALSLVGTAGGWLDRGAIAFFGIRGFGSIFYLAYAMGKADFPELPSVWRIVAWTLIVSIVAHGFLAPIVMRRVSSRSF